MEKQEKNELPKEYLLSKKDFDKKSQNLAKYNIGDHVKRDNFNSFLIQSFAQSRGSVQMQYAFFEWVKKQYGFDGKASLAALIESGGWDALGDNEKEAFLDFYNKIPIHNESQNTSDKKNDLVAYTLEKISKDGVPDSLMDIFKKHSDSRTFAEFKQKIEPEYKEWLEKVQRIDPLEDIHSSL